MNQKIKYLLAPLCFVLLVSCNKTELLQPTTTLSSPSSAEISSNSQAVINQSAGLDRGQDHLKPLDNAVCMSTLQGTWKQVDVLDYQGNSTECSMIYAHLDDTLKFSRTALRPIGWLDPTGFNLLDYTPTTPHECYHGMYRVDCDARILDIAQLYCSLPTPPAGRCGPPPVVRFKIISLQADEVVLEAYTSGWDLETFDAIEIPAEYVERFVYQRIQG